MTSELFIERYRLDITGDLSSLLTFELDNVKDFSTRSTTWSKTIVLPGTANNNKLFGHIFQIGQSNFNNPDLPNVGYNFNASKSARCIVFQDQMQTFKGVMRLMQINIIQGRIEYEVAVFGELVALNVALSGGLLEDLDFSDYDVAWTAAEIQASWDNPGGSGVYFPLAEYGQVSVDKHSWDIRTFRPALYVKEYIDKMFEAAGFRYSSALMDTARFKSAVIPHNRKTLQVLTSRFVEGVNTGLQTIIQDGVAQEAIIPQALRTNTDFTYLAGVWTYTGATTRSFTLRTQIVGDYYSTIEAIQLGIKKNGVQLYTYIPFMAPTFGTVDTNFTANFLDVVVSLATGDTIELFAKVANNVGSYRVRTTFVLFRIELPAPVYADAIVGALIAINDVIPKNVRQIDFLVSIVKLFNLYVYEDKLDSRLIYMTPYIDFYNVYGTDAVDWTYKLNRDKPLKIRPMSELTSKKYDFLYKPDSDYYNDLYRKRYGQGYGDYTFDSQFEFAEANNKLELIFSATPLLGFAGEEKVVSAMVKITNGIEEPVDTNVRIWLTKKITGVASWDILDGPGNVLDSTTDYGYAGHLDDPDAPTSDLNFGALRELFFVLASGDLTRNQFNVYWSSYMAEITDKDSKLLSARFKLTPMDIINLDFSKKVHVDGVLYRLNAIKDYNASQPADCEVELLKVNYLIY